MLKNFLRYHSGLTDSQICDFSILSPLHHHATILTTLCKTASLTVPDHWSWI